MGASRLVLALPAVEVFALRCRLSAVVGATSMVGTTVRFVVGTTPVVGAGVRLDVGEGRLGPGVGRRDELSRGGGDMDLGGDEGGERDRRRQRPLVNGRP
jgi:hypothetical protein